VPDICEDLLSSVDQPLKVVRDETEGKDFLICDYNRDGDSHRSPYSNTYFPPLDDGTVPSDKIRQIEMQANDAFDKYRQMYYEGGLSSVYMWDVDPGFAAVVLLKKTCNLEGCNGCWDSINVTEVQEKGNGRSAYYKLTTTVMLWLQTESDTTGTLNLGGSLTRQIEATKDLSDGHVKNIGELVEEMENKIRSNLSEVYFDKTRKIVNDIRSYESLAEGTHRRKMQSELAKNLQMRNK
jgi:capping protein beta